MEAYHIILAVITGVYLLLCSWWDLKDRMIYTFPCMMLTGLWVSYEGRSRTEDFTCLHSIVFGPLYHFCIN